MPTSFASSIRVGTGCGPYERGSIYGCGSSSRTFCIQWPVLGNPIGNAAGYPWVHGEGDGVALGIPLVSADRRLVAAGLAKRHLFHVTAEPGVIELSGRAASNRGRNAEVSHPNDRRSAGLFNDVEVVVLSKHVHAVCLGDGGDPQIVDLGSSTLLRQAHPKLGPPAGRLRGHR